MRHLIWINAVAGEAIERCRMTMTFDDERKFALDQKLAFEVAAQRNALLGRWVADRVRLERAAADACVAGLVVDEAVHAGRSAIGRQPRPRGLLGS